MDQISESRKPMAPTACATLSIVSEALQGPAARRRFFRDDDECRRTRAFDVELDPPELPVWQVEGDPVIGHDREAPIRHGQAHIRQDCVRDDHLVGMEDVVEMFARSHGASRVSGETRRRT